jgi:hypothetical protein
MPVYATTAEVRQDINMDSTTDDATLERLLRSATQRIDQFCNRPDGFIATTVASQRFYSGSGKTWQMIDECTEITAVAVKDSVTDDTYTAWDVPTTNLAGDGDYLAASGDWRFPEFNRLPYTLLIVDPNGDESIFTFGRFSTITGLVPIGTPERNARGLPTVRVTARWGYADEVPPDIQEACIMQVGHWYKLVQSSMAMTLASAELGTLRMPRGLHPDVQDILVNGRYVRPAVGGRF